MMRKLIVDSCGPEYARRFFLRDGNNFWNDIAATWSTNPQEATLFADAGEISDKQRELMLTQIPGELQTFAAPLIVDVKADERIDLEALKAWLTDAVQVWMNSNFGTGPGDSMVMMRLDWDDLMRKEDIEDAE